MEGRQKKRLVAACGKGGTGKTAFTALLIKALLSRKGAGRILAIDADPAMGLTSALGLEVAQTVGQVRDKIVRQARSAGKPEKQAIADAVDYLLLEALSEREGFALLAMGRSEKVGCYCSVNALIRDGMGTLISQFDTILIDAEAGVEQVNREVVKRVDTPVIVTDSSARGVQTALLIKETAARQSLVSAESFSVVLNRVRDGAASVPSALQGDGMELCGMIPEDDELRDYDANQRPLLDLPNTNAAFRAVVAVASVLGL